MYHDTWDLYLVEAFIEISVKRTRGSSSDDVVRDQLHKTPGIAFEISDLGGFTQSDETHNYNKMVFSFIYKCVYNIHAKQKHTLRSRNDFVVNRHNEAWKIAGGNCAKDILWGII